MPKGIPDTRVLTAEEKELALKLTLENVSQRNIAKQLGFKDQGSYIRCKKRDPIFLEEVQSMRQESANDLALSTLSLADDYANPLAARVKFECIKWYTSVCYPEVYGEKLNVAINHTVDIAAALHTATKRVFPLQQGIPELIQPVAIVQNDAEDTVLEQNPKSDPGV